MPEAAATITVETYGGREVEDFWEAVGVGENIRGRYEDVAEYFRRCWQEGPGEPFFLETPFQVYLVAVSVSVLLDSDPKRVVFPRETWWRLYHQAVLVDLHLNQHLQGRTWEEVRLDVEDPDIETEEMFLDITKSLVKYAGQVVGMS